MRKLISFVHISLDGFVAGPSGEMDWIKLDDNMFKHVEDRIRDGDTAMYGRVTFELMESYWPTAGQKPNAGRHDIEHAKWYNKIHKIVLSKTLDASALKNTTIISSNLSEKINEIKAGSGSDIFVFGSPTATHALNRLKLIDGYWLFLNPVILGRGIPLFNGIEDTTSLSLDSTHKFSNGVIELNYSVV